MLSQYSNETFSPLLLENELSHDQPQTIRDFIASGIWAASEAGTAADAPHQEGQETSRKAGDPSNTPATTRQIETDDLTTGGLDSIYSNIEGKWNSETFEATREQFTQAKLAAQQTKKGITIIDLPNGESYGVRSKGIFRGIYAYEWCLLWHGNRVFIRDKSLAREGEPLVFVQYDSAFLIQWGEEAVDMILGFLDTLGFTYWGDSTSRIDVCVDIPNMAASELIKLAIAGHAVKLARGKINVTYDNNGNPETYTTGKDVQVCIYDKTKELKDNDDTQKTELLIANRWGEMPQTATRVEFRIHRNALQRMGIKSFRDFVEYLPEVAKALCTKWFRITENKPDRENRNQTREDVHPQWQRVTDAFQEWTGKPKTDKLPKPTLKLPEKKRLFTQAFGCLISEVAKSATIVKCTTDITKEFAEFVNKELARSGKTIESIVDTRRKELRAKFGRSPTINPEEIPF